VYDVSPTPEEVDLAVAEVWEKIEALAADPEALAAFEVPCSDHEE